MRTIRVSGKIGSIAGMYFCLILGQVFGQTNVGAIIGHVSDQSGGAILGATGTLLNPATNERRAVETDERGDYVFNAVRPATYTLSVEFKGFKTAVREKVIVQVAEKVGVNFT